MYKSSRKAKARVDQEFTAVIASTNAMADILSQNCNVLNVNTFLKEMGGEAFTKYHKDSPKNT